MASTYFFTPHSFIHTHTSVLIEAGVGIKEIQQWLGHTDIKLQ
jgi:integrase